MVDFGAQSTVLGKDKDVVEDLIRTIRAVPDAIVPLFCLMPALQICEAHCRQALMGDVPVSCAEHQHRFPEDALSAQTQIWFMERPTSLPDRTQRLQGLELSHRRCFCLQFTHADGTCTLDFLVALGEVGPTAYCGCG